MYNIRKFNKIADVGLDLFDKNLFECSDDCENPDGILVRSASLHEYQINSNLKAIARAGAGTNNIPIPACTEAGVVVFNTPGANANAVKELVLTSLLISSRNVVGGIEWAKSLNGKGEEIPKLVEKGKSQFIGPEIEGKKLGIIGLGAIGILVANDAVRLGMEVYGFDTNLTVDAALRITRSVNVVKDINDIYANCDYITIHIPLNAETKGYIGEEAISKMKDGVRVLNFSRGELVDEDSMEKALNDGKVAYYITDFPNARTIAMKNVIPIPHLGASTPESEDNCAVMAVNQLADYLKNGNIKNSVNFPNVSCERSTGTRLCLMHKNIPSMLGKTTAVIGDSGYNIDHMLSKFKGDNAYTILDLSEKLEKPDVVDKLKSIEGVNRVIVID